MRNINYKYVIGALAAVIGAIFAYYGITADSLTTWDAVFDLAKNALSNPAVLIAAGGAVYAYFAKNKRNGDDK